MNSYQFIAELASSLVSFSEKRVGRPSKSTNNTVPSCGHGKKAKHPSEDVRHDSKDHFPIWLSKKGGKKCKYCKTS